MDSNAFTAAQRPRHYSRAHAMDEHVHGELTDHSSYSQPQYAPREISDSVHGNWTPSSWPNSSLPTTVHAHQDLRNPSMNEAQDAFNIAFQLPAPWSSLPNPVPNGSSANMSLPFPGCDLTYMNRMASTTMSASPADAPMHLSSGYGRIAVDGNNDSDGHTHYVNTAMEPIITSQEARPLYNVAWASSSRESESSSQTPPESIQTPRTQSNKDGVSSNRSDTESDSNQRSRGRLNHDLTEKRYRRRLNYQFETLLKALPAHLIAESEGSIGCPDDRREKRISKAEVLMLAKEHIETLGKRQTELEEENKSLAARIKDMNEAWIRKGGGHPLML